DARPVAGPDPGEDTHPAPGSALLRSDRPGRGASGPSRADREHRGRRERASRDLRIRCRDLRPAGGAADDTGWAKSRGYSEMIAWPGADLAALPRMKKAIS